jgi:hypothetical protein
MGSDPFSGGTSLGAPPLTIESRTPPETEQPYVGVQLLLPLLLLLRYYYDDYYYDYYYYCWYINDNILTIMKQKMLEKIWKMWGAVAEERSTPTTGRFLERSWDARQAAMGNGSTEKKSEIFQNCSGIGASGLRSTEPAAEAELIHTRRKH